MAATSDVLVRKAAVLGAGTMGSRIAAHLANAGLPVVLLDVTSDASAHALEALRKSRPAAFFDPAYASRIETGNFTDHLALLAGCDWVIEAVAENLAIKQGLLVRVAPHLGPGAVLTTNTSGLSIAAIAQLLPEALRRRWFGTHFFNPPRYMRLLELIATPETDPAVADAIRRFADLRLGKDVVTARDTPNFIANRIGVFIMLEAVRLLQAEDLTIEEVDALTGAAIGWPRTGTFRLADLVGIDVLAHVAGNFAAARPDALEAEAQLPPFLRTLLERRWLGDKTGQGFYRKEKGADGREIRYALDWKSAEYRLMGKPALPSLEMAKNLERLGERLPYLLTGDIDKDKAARFHWRLLTALWNYAADCLPEIADNCADIDRAMRAGFNWEMGPFEMWDAAGLRHTAERLRARGERLSAQAEALLEAGAEAWHRGREYFHPATRQYRPAAGGAALARVARFKSDATVVERNPGASLVDLGDGVACLELHSPKNAIGEDIVRLVTATLQADSDAVRNFQAFVIASDAEHFSVGANLLQLLLSAQEGEWDEVDFAVRAFQRMTQSIKFCPRPVVVAPFSMCLGGGAEMALHGARRQAHAELYMGLVEAGVGLLPAGGGCKEMTLRALGAASAVETLEAMKRTLETVAMAKVSTSAVEARRFGLLGPADGMTMNRDRLITDARAAALALAAAGYAPPIPRTDIAAPGDSMLATLELGIRTMRGGEFISDHDVTVARRVAYALCGGAVTPGALVSEQYLLDLEREGFLSLCGEKKTQERIAYTLKSGKPLRN